jgi:drug/metabolite transporter (DMT)-like permease
MNWLVFELASVLFFSVAILFQRVAMKQDKTDPTAFAIASQAIVAVLLFFYGMTIGSFHVQDILQRLPSVALMTLLYGAGALAIQFSLKHTEASIFTILFSARGFVTGVVSMLFLSEIFSSQMLIGGLLIFAGVYLVSGIKRGVKLDKGMVFALIAAFCYGIANANDKYLLQSINLSTYLPISFLLPALFTAAAFPNKLKEIPALFQQSSLKNILFYCVLYSLSAIGFFSAILRAPSVTQVSMVGLTTTVTVVIFAALFLGERDNLKKKVAAAILSIIGTILLS